MSSILGSSGAARSLGRNDLLAGIDDVHKLWLQGGTANKEAIDVGLLGQLLGIGSGHRAAILDAQRFGYFL